MEFRPTPESWRVALLTAIGASLVTCIALRLAIGSGWLALFWLLVVLAGVATLIPALGALTASVDASERGVTATRFGRAQTYAWDDIEAVRVVERAARVPDGTAYHRWLRPGRVAVPALVLRDGRVRELPALVLRDGRVRELPALALPLRSDGAPRVTDLVRELTARAGTRLSVS